MPKPQIYARMAQDMAKALQMAQCQYWIRTPDGEVLATEGIVARDATVNGIARTFHPPRGTYKAIYGSRYDAMKLEEVVILKHSEYAGKFTADDMRSKVVSCMIRTYGAKSQYTTINDNGDIETMRVK